MCCFLPQGFRNRLEIFKTKINFPFNKHCPEINVIPYTDDTIFHVNIFSDGIQNLKAFKKFKKANLKLNTKKFRFLWKLEF